MTDLSALRFTTEHEWVALDGETATVGITYHAACELGDVVYLELPKVGDVVAAGQACGEIESTKSVSEIYAPLSGEVIAVNDAAVDDPSIVNSDSYGGGWLLKLRADPSGADGLLDHAAYTELIGGEA